ncbi:hypothetical protein IFM89_012850 [Coptis chinensis]|uniref:BUB1 N-terminal domain-containing protein n=1 Tax=Coptis chinensis TaxID=261450 RepID=A0A835LRA1_9MAGN|nr:hypothetical protein IFM89_012850 [Coptis chinensis]
MANTSQNDLFTSLISEIKQYNGKDPLLPWLRGIKKMRDSLPPHLLKEKLPRFLQKCAQNFQTDSRYRNDLRYVRVWIRLMDFVDNPKRVLKTMEMNKIGIKQALFYQAYALYFVKLKKFEEAEKIYHLGVHNLAEPAGELQKSYEQFLLHIELYRKKKTRHQERRATMAARSTHSYNKENEKTNQVACIAEARTTGDNLKVNSDFKGVDAEKFKEDFSMDKRNGIYDSKALLSSNHLSKQKESIDVEPDKANMGGSDETVVFKFVDTAIVGKFEAEDACHHGLVDPTINMKEAMNAINNMFREPLELEALHRRRSHRTRPKVSEQRISSGFEIFVDEDLDKGLDLSDENKENGALPSSSAFISTTKPAASIGLETKTRSPPQETYKFFVDDEYSECSGGIDDSNCQDAFIFPSANDLLSPGSDGQDVQGSPIMKFREDTVVGRFVGSAILDEPEVENACHHGLLDPTINLKEAMDDINSMFGKPLDFVKTNRIKNQGKKVDKERDYGGFSVLPDEDLETPLLPQTSSCSSSKFGSESDLFELTINTKKAMDDINEMFGMPLDF